MGISWVDWGDMGGGEERCGSRLLGVLKGKRE